MLDDGILSVGLPERTSVLITRRYTNEEKSFGTMLTLVMLVSCFPMNLITKTRQQHSQATADGPLSLTAREGKSGFATGREGKGSTANTHHGKLNTDRFELSSTPFSENDAAASLRSGDEVTFIVVLKSASLLGNYSVKEISERTEAVKSPGSRNKSRRLILRKSRQPRLSANQSTSLVLIIRLQ